MKVAMIGLGKLGLPCAEVMAEHYDICGYDVTIVEPTMTVAIKSSIQEAVEGRDLIFVAVPTPHDPAYGGSTPIADMPPKNFDYSIVQHVLSEINPHVNKNQLVVLISTVLPGTVRQHLQPLITNARFIYNPYLIAMGSVKWDMVNPECLIIGTEDGTRTGDAGLLIDFYKPIMANSPQINVGTWDEAEAIKIFYNTFISAKIGLVNMIQDVAEANGNINVDVVTDALKAATQRITGPKYLTAGMGDAGACHPRDNIALRWLAQEYEIGYDLFDTVMHAREIQAKNLAQFLFDTALQDGKAFSLLPIVIHGKAYKPDVPYCIGSYSTLVGHYLKELGVLVKYVDPLADDPADVVATVDTPAVFLWAHNRKITYEYTGDQLDTQPYCKIQPGSIIVDPWRKLSSTPDVKVVHYGNTRVA